ncbi:MAG: beta-eliminating lyase-related protein, partial [Bacteroidota bacterium]|nr:beta-eliminating lyase-related protein [Bacteroidota bacterium]
EAAIRPPEYYYPRTRLVCIENTHNRAGGRIVPFEVHRRLFFLCRANEIAVHLDGARIWHAHVETGVPLGEYGRYADTVSVCFSKGLGAPVGSMLLGTHAHILRARKIRKTLGGAMRQAGILAAAAEYALRVNLPRLAEDHAKARRFAAALADRRSFSLDVSQVETNMVLLHFPGKERARSAVSRLADRGIGTGLISPSVLRVVFHGDIPAEALDEIIGIFTELFD